MTDWLQLGPMMVNLERVDALQFDQARSTGKPGRCHRLLFADRTFSFDDDSQEGLSLRTWAEGEGFDFAPALPFVPAPQGPVNFGPVRPTPQAVVDMIHAWSPERDGVAEACVETPSGGAA